VRHGPLNVVFHPTKRRSPVEGKGNSSLPGTETVSARQSLSPPKQCPAPVTCARRRHLSIQRRARRAFVGSGKQVWSTSEIMRWMHPRPRPIGGRYRQRQSLRRVLERYCERVGRSASVGRPILSRLKD
jgi:hypothetical protein